MSQAPSSSSPQPDDHGFDPLVFWIRYRSAIRACTALLLTSLLVYSVLEVVDYQKKTSAAQEFAAAKTPEQLGAFISGHSGTPGAGNASLLLAGKQRADGQIDAAVKTLNDFIAKSPSHPMIGSAHLALASIHEQQGRQEEAIAAYRRILSVDSRGVTAPVALLRLARIYKGQGKLEEAKALYESLQSQFPNSSFANEALQEGQQIAGAAQPVPGGEAPVAPVPVNASEQVPAGK